MKTKAEIKKAIICKEIQEFRISTYQNKTYIPKAGDVGIFKVIEIGKHSAIQNDSGKNSYIFPGDYIMAAFGNRYATNQFEGYVPDQIMDQYQILGQGGCVGVLKSMHAKFDKIGATQLKLVGYAINEESEIFNTHYLRDKEVTFRPHKLRDFQTILSIGSSMDSGKTTSAAYLCRGLKRAGKKVAFIKLTGTVFSKDKRFVKDCGAHIAYDFSNLGFPSTYMYSLESILNIYEGLLNKVETVRPDYVVLEIADGLLQRETNMLLKSKLFMNTIDHILLSCGDSLSVMSGLAYLNQINFQPFAISGLINVSPLLVNEVKSSTNVPLLGLEDLMAKSITNYLTGFALKRAM